jgi:NTP pyrophosphatase (non-canonical NTP hydrolase)
VLSLSLHFAGRGSGACDNIFETNLIIAGGKENAMHLAEFLNYIDLENQRLQQRYPQLDKEKARLARMVKLSEEMGEMADHILALSGLQRKDKMENFSRKALAGEFADLIITTFLLAKSADVDVVKALDEKIAELNLRPV